MLVVDGAMVHTCRSVQTYILSLRLENRNENSNQEEMEQHGITKKKKIFLTINHLSP
jgi:hypothetical protein